MKTSDISQFKEAVISAIEKWSDGVIDKMFPTKVETRAIMKNYVSNLLSMYGDKIEDGIDQVYLLLGDKDGNINSDSVVDMICGLLNEIQEEDIEIGRMHARMGKGQIEILFPDGFISRMIFGDLKGVRITNDDIKEIKNFLNE